MWHQLWIVIRYVTMVYNHDTFTWFIWITRSFPFSIPRVHYFTTIWIIEVSFSTFLPHFAEDIQGPCATRICSAKCKNFSVLFIIVIISRLYMIWIDTLHILEVWDNRTFVFLPDGRPGPHGVKLDLKNHSFVRTWFTNDVGSEVFFWQQQQNLRRKYICPCTIKAIENE